MGSEHRGRLARGSETVPLTVGGPPPSGPSRRSRHLPSGPSRRGEGQEQEKEEEEQEGGGAGQRSDGGGRKRGIMRIRSRVGREEDGKEREKEEEVGEEEWGRSIYEAP
eukprot:2811529-Pyramimonas_sp.AAC.1